MGRGMKGVAVYDAVMYSEADMEFALTAGSAC